MKRASNTIASNSETLEIELNDSCMRVVEQAALLQGLSVEDFIINSAYKTALRMLDSNEVVILNEASWEKLQDLLKSPPMPSDQLRKLMRS